jgi:hypothetical protein
MRASRGNEGQEQEAGPGGRSRRQEQGAGAGGRSRGQEQEQGQEQGSGCSKIKAASRSSLPNVFVD